MEEIRGSNKVRVWGELEMEVEGAGGKKWEKWCKEMGSMKDGGNWVWNLRVREAVKLQ